MQSQELEHYLGKLDRTLGDIAVSERAEIVTEIKSHVIEAIQNDPSQSVDSILKSLGEPEQVANRYLLERGLKPQQAPRQPILKWLVVGFLGTFATVVIGVVLLVSQFMPFIHVDEKEGRVQILGGLIDINGGLGRLEIGGVQIDDFGNKEELRISGAKDIGALKIKTLHVDFSNGKMTFKKGSDLTFRYSCKVAGGESDTVFTHDIDSGLKIDLSKVSYGKCTITVPFGLVTTVSGKNGKITLLEPQGDFDLTLMNGQFSVQPDEHNEYNYDLKVVNGRVDAFNSAESDSAIKIKASLVNGTIRRR